VWSRVGKYCDIGEWLQIPCTITSGKDGEFGAVRSVANEVLVGKTEPSYTYTQTVRDGRPYNLYHGTLEARPVTTTTSKLVYTLFFDNSMLADDAAREADRTRRITQFTRALENMKILAEGGTLPPAPARGGAPRGSRWRLDASLFALLHAFCFDPSMADVLNRITIESLYPLIQQAIRVLLVLLAALIAVKIINRSVPKLRKRIVQVMSLHAGGSAAELEKRGATLCGIFHKTISVLIWGLAIVTSLAQVGVNIGPILASAGVVGLAVGFGAQNLVRDAISGLFMLLENQIRVNDVAVINGTGGLVEELNLRTTVLRGMDGVVHIFPNGAITTLSNMTREYSYYVFDLGVAYKEDTDRVADVVKGIADQMMQEDKYGPLILAPLEVLGVDQFADSAVIIKARIKTLPIKQWEVGREMNRRIKKKFEELGIEIPFPHQTLYFGEASKPFRITGDHADRDQLKALIRELLEEHAAPTGSASRQATPNASPGL